MVVGQGVNFYQTLLAMENCRKGYKSFCYQIIILFEWMMNLHQLSNVIKRAQLSCKGVIFALHNVPLCMNKFWLLLVPVKTALDLLPLRTRCVVIHLAMNRPRRISVFDGSSANVTLFSSRKILLFWKVFVCCGSSAL